MQVPKFKEFLGEQKIDKLKILETEWEFHTHPKKLMEVANNKLGMSSRKINQILV